MINLVQYLLTPIYDPVSFHTLGCREEKQNIKVPTLEDTNYLLQGNYKERSHSIRNCAISAYLLNYTIFGIKVLFLCFFHICIYPQYVKYDLKV